ncbi:hypothetical protein N8812_02365 [Acidimicrobiia bacterium]|nr:hypothetical protein [Acidimicrobiia bacterium]
MKKYFVVVLAFFTFCSNDADISTDLSEIEKDIIQTEEKIEDLESKDSLTPEEEQELENLEEQFEELEKDLDEAEEELEEDLDEAEEDSEVAEEETTTIPVYQKGEIIDVLTIQAYDKDRIAEIPSEFFKREVTINGVRIMATGNVGGQSAVPDAFIEKVARMVELFTDPNGEDIDATKQKTFIKTLRGDSGTYHAGMPTLQKVARGGGDDYSPNFLYSPESYDLDYLFDSHYDNDMVWYLNSSGDGIGNGDVDAAEVIEHVFHTIHMSGLDAIALKQYSEFSSDWASGPTYAAMKEAYDGGLWDSEGYGGDAWKSDPFMFEVAQKEYLYLLNFSMFEYTSLWENGTLSPEWNDSMRTPSGILTNNPLGYELYNTYIAPVISKPDLSTIRDIFQDGDVGDPTVAGSSGY